MHRMADSVKYLEPAVQWMRSSYPTNKAAPHERFANFPVLQDGLRTLSLSVVCTSGGLIPAVYRGGFVRREIVGRVPR